MALKKLKEKIYHCFRCGYCQEMIRPITNTYGVCPVYDELKFEHYGSRGRIAIARGILEGKLDYDKKLIDVLYTCLGCGLCAEVCPMYDWAKVDTPLVIRALHQDIFEKGYEIPESHRQSLANIEKEQNPFARKKKERLAWSQDLNMPTGGDIILFPGCDFSYQQPETIRKLVTLLKKAKMDIGISKDEGCCGYPALWAGNVSLARKMAINNVEEMQKAGAKKVVTMCPSCYITLKDDYPELIGKKSNFEVLHITEVLANLVEEERLRFKEFPHKVTYHDPCQLARRGNIYEAPRRVLKSIPNIEFVEPLRHSLNTWCCGGGGLVPLMSLNLSLNLASKRMMELKDNEVETVVTACPFCEKMLRLASKKLKMNTKVYYISDFLSKLDC